MSEYRPARVEIMGHRRHLGRAREMLWLGGPALEVENMTGLHLEHYMYRPEAVFSAEWITQTELDNELHLRGVERNLAAPEETQIRRGGPEKCEHPCVLCSDGSHHFDRFVNATIDPESSVNHEALASGCKTWWECKHCAAWEEHTDSKDEQPDIIDF